MSWLEIAALLIMGLGLFAGAFLVAQRPSFWAGLALVLLKAGWPYLIRYVGKRMSPEEEADWHRAIRQGRGDEWLRNRRRD